MTSLRSRAESFLGNQPFQLIEIANKGNILKSDAVISESYSKSATVTSYPVEQGNEISEHAMVNNFSISINGISSDSSMSYFDIIENVASSAIGKLFGGASKSQGVWNTLNRWLDDGTALTVKCLYEKDGFKDPFVIESLNVPRDKSIGAAIKYNITLRRISLVQVGKASLVDTTLGIFQFGAQQTEEGAAGNAVGSQATSQRTEAELTDNIPRQVAVFKRQVL